jgi:hypothetical protein
MTKSMTQDFSEYDVSDVSGVGSPRPCGLFHAVCNVSALCTVAGLASVRSRDTIQEQARHTATGQQQDLSCCLARQ